jgi:MFS family permease
MSSALRVLRHRDFRYLFLGQAASQIGDRAVIVALALYITQRSGSPSELGVILFAQALALVLLLLLGGVWADRLPRHRIMVATDVVRAMLHALLAGLILFGRPAVWEIAAIETLFGAAQAFFQPAYSGLLPQTVPEARIQDARAVTESMANLAFLVGPVIATALVLGLGAWEAFALDAATFALSAALLMRVTPRRRAGTAIAQAGIVEDLRAGWREVRSRSWVWVTIVVFTGSVMCVYAQWYALAPRIARDVYGSAGLFGVLESLTGVGAVLGSFIGLRWRPMRPLVMGILLVLFWPLNDLAFALGAPLALLVVLSLALGFGWSLMGVWWETALAQHIPPGALSRVSAWDWMGSLALLPLGYVLSGPLAGAVGARTVLGVGSVIGIGLLVIGVLPRQTRALSLAVVPAEEFAGDVGVGLRGEAEVAHVDTLVGAVDERR